MRVALLASAAVFTVAVCAQQPSLDYEIFKTQVQPIFLSKRAGHARCVSCHVERTGLSLAAMSPGAKTWNEEQTRQNYRTASQFVQPGQPTASRLLMHPLSKQAGGDPFHAGGEQFDSRNNPEWQAMAKWANSAKAETTTAAPELDFEFYRTRVEPIFLNPRKGGGAAAGGVGCFVCHTMFATPLKLQPLAAGASAWTEEQSRKNFAAAATLVVPGEPLKSRLFMQPLATDAGGSARHTGGKFWKSVDDPEAKVVSEWIRKKH